MTITYTPERIAEFLGSTVKNRRSRPAVECVDELAQKMNFQAAAQLRRESDRLAQRAGFKLNELTGADLADLFVSLPLGRYNKPTDAQIAGVRSRVAKHRALGKNLGLVLTDPQAIAALANLIEQHGSVKKAITAALIESAKRA